jgi:hypothetical protein
MHLTQIMLLLSMQVFPATMDTTMMITFASIALVTLHETLIFQWRIICCMCSEEALSERDAAFDHLILQWILSQSLLCFALCQTGSIQRLQKFIIKLY